jgi:tRNA threonylcarbamoyladenosine biosynthesis protein TsaB
MKLLAIETSTEACSASLYLDGEVLVRFEVAPREHSRLLLPMMDSLLAEAELSLSQLDALAFGRGPGGFTGVRIATGVIQGVGLGTGLPVVPVSSLASLAQGMLREFGAEQVLAALDARMHEIYWGMYRVGPDGVMEEAGKELVIPPDQVPEPTEAGWIGAGSGWDSYHGELQQRLGGACSAWTAERFPSAWDIAVLGAAGIRKGLAVSAELALPVYLRDEVVSRPSGKN